MSQIVFFSEKPYFHCKSNCSITRGDISHDQINLFGEDETKVQPDRTISTGGQPAHCASYHHDGRLIAIGCDHGFIKICDTLSRATIRTFSTHGTRGGYKIRSTYAKETIE